MRIIIFGIQGGGKGTQGKLLKERFGFSHITTGEVFRNHMEAETELGLIAKGFINNGKLVPDNYVIDIVQEELKNASENFVMDGFPRNEIQQKYLLDNYDIDMTILLKLDKQKAIDRLTSRRVCRKCQQEYNLVSYPSKIEGVCDKCGGVVNLREDDVGFAIVRRIERFEVSTKTVVDNFRKMNKLIELDGDRSMPEIHRDIVEKLNLKMYHQAK